MTEWPTPRTVKDVCRFLGFVGYYRRFVKDFAKLSAPIAELLRGIPKDGYNAKTLVEWTAVRQQAFDAMKTALTTAPLLAYPDYNHPFRLYTDASKQGMGAVLAQKQGGRERVIAYASRSLRPTERNDANYSAFKLEFLALVWAVTEKFRDYLAATPFVAVTDCNPLAHQATARLGALEQRWISRLANYLYTVEYRSGHSNVNADALSRLPAPAEPEEGRDPREDEELLPFSVCPRPISSQLVHTVRVPPIATEEEVDWAKWQRACPHIRRLQRYLRTRQELSPAERDVAPEELLNLWSQRDRLRIRDGLLYRCCIEPKTSQTKWQLIVPRAVVEALLQAYHDKSGHFGTQKTEANLWARFYWRSLREDVEEWCKNCLNCSTKRPAAPGERAPLHPITSQAPLELVTLDHVKMEPSHTGYTYALTIIDHYTKFAVALPVKDLTARTTAEVFWRSFVRPYGFPSRILTDQGPAF